MILAVAACLHAARGACLHEKRRGSALELTLTCNTAAPMPPVGAATVIRIAASPPRVWEGWGTLGCDNGTAIEVDVLGVTMRPPVLAGPCVSIQPRAARRAEIARGIAAAALLLLAAVAAAAAACRSARRQQPGGRRAGKEWAALGHDR